MSDEHNVVDMLIRTAAQNAAKHLARQKFLETELKQLITAVRTTPDTPEALRVAANECVKRLQEHARQEEMERLKDAGGIGPKA